MLVELVNMNTGASEYVAGPIVYSQYDYIQINYLTPYNGIYSETWRYNRRHNDYGPALVCRGGTYWYKCGRFHRTDGPALIAAGGLQEWYQEGGLHRIGGPATLWSPIDYVYAQNGNPHRLGGLPAIYDPVNSLSEIWEYGKYIKSLPLSVEYDLTKEQCGGDY